MLNVTNLVKSYSEFTLNIDGVTLKNNKIYALIGKNGAGKTTFIQCLMGLIPYEGTITFDNKELKDNRLQILKDVGYVEERLSFNDDLTIRFFFKFMETIYSNWDDLIYHRLIKALDFDKYLNKKIKELSRGNSLKASLIATLSHSPKYIILDEPTSGLDIAVRSSLMKALNNFSSPENTILFSTHILEDIEEISSDIILIEDGKMIVNSSKAELFKKENTKSISEIVKRYITL